MLTLNFLLDDFSAIPNSKKINSKVVNMLIKGDFNKRYLLIIAGYSFYTVCD